MSFPASHSLSDSGSINQQSHDLTRNCSKSDDFVEARATSVPHSAIADQPLADSFTNKVATVSAENNCSGEYMPVSQECWKLPASTQSCSSSEKNERPNKSMKYYDKYHSQNFDKHKQFKF